MINHEVVRRWRKVLGTVAAVFSLAAAPAVATAAFPERAVTVVVPFSPGSGTDTGTRLLATPLERALGKPIVVDNRPGGSGALGAGLVAQAAPDGYTLLMGTNSTMSANPLLIKNLSYDPEADFIPVGMVATFEGLLVVNASMPVKSVEELVEHARANPGKVTFATGNVTGLVMASIFNNHLGLEMLRVPYKSNAEALIDLVGNQVDVMFPDIASSMPHVKSGALRALASVTLGDVSPLAPDMKPLSQTLVPDLKLVGWIGLFAPKGTPQDVVSRLAEAVEAAVTDRAFQEKIRSVGATANFLSPAELTEYIATERAGFSRIFKDLGMEPQ